MTRTELNTLTGFTVVCTFKDGTTLLGVLEKDRGRRGRFWVGCKHVSPRGIASITFPKVKPKITLDTKADVRD